MAHKFYHNIPTQGNYGEFADLLFKTCDEFFISRSTEMVFAVYQDKSMYMRIKYTAPENKTRVMLKLDTQLGEMPFVALKYDFFDLEEITFSVFKWHLSLTDNGRVDLLQVKIA
jgi:hypothetical protein